MAYGAANFHWWPGLDVSETERGRSPNPDAGLWSCHLPVAQPISERRFRLRNRDREPAGPVSQLLPDACTTLLAGGSQASTLAALHASRLHPAGLAASCGLPQTGAVSQSLLLHHAALPSVALHLAIAVLHHPLLHHPLLDCRGLIAVAVARLRAVGVWAGSRLATHSLASAIAAPIATACSSAACERVSRGQEQDQADNKTDSHELLHHTTPLSLR